MSKKYTIVQTIVRCCGVVRDNFEEVKGRTNDVTKAYGFDERGMIKKGRGLDQYGRDITYIYGKTREMKDSLVINAILLYENLYLDIFFENFYRAAAGMRINYDTCHINTLASIAFKTDIQCYEDGGDMAITNGEEIAGLVLGRQKKLTDLFTKNNFSESKLLHDNNNKIIGDFEMCKQIAEHEHNIERRNEITPFFPDTLFKPLIRLITQYWL